MAPEKTALSSTSKLPRGTRACAFTPVSITRFSTNTTKDAVIEDASIGLNLHADLEFIDVEEEEVEGDE